MERRAPPSPNLEGIVTKTPVTTCNKRWWLGPPPRGGCWFPPNEAKWPPPEMPLSTNPNQMKKGGGQLGYLLPLWKPQSPPRRPKPKVKTRVFVFGPPKDKAAATDPIPRQLCCCCRQHQRKTKPQPPAPPPAPFEVPPPTLFPRTANSQEGRDHWPLGRSPKPTLFSLFGPNTAPKLENAESGRQCGPAPIRKKPHTRGNLPAPPPVSLLIFVSETLEKPERFDRYPNHCPPGPGPRKRPAQMQRTPPPLRLRARTTTNRCETIPAPETRFFLNNKI